MAILSSLFLIKQNSFLRLLSPAPRWAILALSLHLHHPLTHLYMTVKSLLIICFLPSLALTPGRQNGTHPVFSRTVLLWTPCLGKHFLISLSSNASPSFWKFTLLQTVKRINRFQPSSYRLIARCVYISKVFESVLSCKIQEHLNSHNLLIVITVSNKDALLAIF